MSFPRQADRGLSKIISIANNPTSQKKGFEPLVNVNGSPSQNQLSLLFGADEQDNIQKSSNLLGLDTFVSKPSVFAEPKAAVRTSSRLSQRQHTLSRNTSSNLMVSQNAEAEEMAYKGLFKGTSLFPQQAMEPASSPRFTQQGSKHGHNLRKTPSRDVSFNYGGNTINQMVQNATRRHSKSIRKTMEKMSGLQD